MGQMPRMSPSQPSAVPAPPNLFALAPQYMAPPPPGAYPPPPNGAGPRPSMRPTPIPSHAHPYYHHQSPQRTPVSYHLVPAGQPVMTDGHFAVQHAMPYQMMMPPPGPVPPHGYDPNQQPPPPPVQMGGVSHA